MLMAAALGWWQFGQEPPVKSGTAVSGAVPPKAQAAKDSANEPTDTGTDRKQAETEQPVDAPVAPPETQGEGEPAPPQQGEAAGPDARVTFAFVGDVMMAGNVAKLAEEKGYDYPFELVSGVLGSADIAAGNLETPITERGEPLDKTWVYRTSPKAVPAFVKAGFDVFNLANNHVLDYGTVGLTDTFKYLNEASLHYTGAGMNDEEAFAPVILERSGIRVAFLGFSRVVPDGTWKAGRDHPGVAPTYNYTRAVEAIERAEQEADVVVVVVHWGEEREPYPNEIQVELARRYVDAGADLVIGSHPHVLQGIESYKGKWIAYSLGNFVFTTNNNRKTWDSIILKATCTGSGDCELEAVPVNNAWAHPEPLEGEERLRILRELSQLSLNASVQDSGKVAAEAQNKEWELKEP